MATTESLIRTSSKTSVTNNTNNTNINAVNPTPTLNSAVSVMPKSNSELSNYRPSSKQVQQRPNSKESTKIAVDINVSPSSINNQSNTTNSAILAEPTANAELSTDSTNNLNKLASVRPNSTQSNRSGPVQDVIPRALTRVSSNASAHAVNNQKEIENNKLAVIEEDDDVEDVDDIDDVEELERETIETKPSMRLLIYMLIVNYFRRKVDDDNEIDIDLEDEFNDEDAEETIINIQSPIAVKQRTKNIRPPLPEEEESLWKSVFLLFI